MKKQRSEQLEMFAPNELKGGVKRNDVFMEESVAAYLKYMQKLSELDDEACRAILRECEAVSGKAVDGVYNMKTLACSINIFHFMALEDMIKMRMYGGNGDVYSHHEEPFYHGHVTFPVAFIEARRIFKENYSSKFNGKDSWIVNLTYIDDYYKTTSKMKAIEIHLYPYKQYPQIIEEFLGNRFKKPIDSLFPLFDFISEPLFDHTQIFYWEHNYCIIQKGNLFGLIRDDGTVMVPPQYVQVIPTCKNRFSLLSTEFKWGVIGIKSDNFLPKYKDKFFIPCVYDEIGDYSEGFYVVKQDGKYGYAPLVKDSLYINPQFEDARPFYEGIAAVKKNGKWGFIDKTLTQITQFEYDEVDDFKDGTANVWKNGSQYQIDFEGNPQTAADKSFSSYYHKIGDSHEGLQAVTDCNSLGFIDASGNVKIPLEYDQNEWSCEVQNCFSEGFACVCKGDYWGYIDKRNRIVFPFVLNVYSPIFNGYAIVSDGSSSGIVTIKHFVDYLQGKKIPFRTERPPRKPRYEDDYDSGWSRRDLQDAYEAALEDDISNEWNFD